MFWLIEAFYVTVGTEADNHHLLESIASCEKKITKFIMYFTINLAFTNYLDMFSTL